MRSSYIWSQCKVLKLTKKHELILGSQSLHVREIKELADWLLDIGEVNLDGPNDRDTNSRSLDTISDLINFLYPSI